MLILGGGGGDYDNYLVWPRSHKNVLVTIQLPSSVANMTEDGDKTKK